MNQRDRAPAVEVSLLLARAVERNKAAKGEQREQCVNQLRRQTGIGELKYQGRSQSHSPAQ